MSRIEPPLDYQQTRWHWFRYQEDQVFPDEPRMTPHLWLSAIQEWEKEPPIGAEYAGLCRTTEEVEAVSALCVRMERNQLANILAARLTMWQSVNATRFAEVSAVLSVCSERALTSPTEVPAAEELLAFRRAAATFLARVASGEVRSVKTAAEFRAILEKHCPQYLPGSQEASK